LSLLISIIVINIQVLRYSISTHLIYTYTHDNMSTKFILFCHFDTVTSNTSTCSAQVTQWAVTGAWVAPFIGAYRRHIICSNRSFDTIASQSSGNISKRYVIPSRLITSIGMQGIYNHCIGQEKFLTAQVSTMCVRSYLLTLTKAFIIWTSSRRSRTVILLSPL